MPDRTRDGQTTSDEKECKRAKNAAYRLLTLRSRSRAELEAKLLEKGFSSAVVSAVLADIERLGYIDDRAFARQWASSRIRLRGYGRRRIDQELKRKGISGDIIREALADVLYDHNELDTAKRAAERKMKTLALLDRQTRRRRIAGFLERRGFSPDIIRSVLNSVPQGHNE